MASGITFKRCEDHGIDYVAWCPFCKDGVEPTRFSEARADFAGVPVSGTDVLPHVKTIDYLDVVRLLGRQLVDVERDRRLVLEPYNARRNNLKRQMKEVRVDPTAMEYAMRVHIGMDRPERHASNELVQAYLLLLRDGL